MMTSKMLCTKNVNSNYSGELLINVLNILSNVDKKYGVLYSKEHAPYYGNYLSVVRCAANGCVRMVYKRNRHCFRDLSQLLIGLCKEKDSFRQIMAGFEKINKSLHNGMRKFVFDYYGGYLFLGLYASQINTFNPLSEIMDFKFFYWLVYGDRGA